MGMTCLHVSVCTWPDAILWCYLWWCRGFAIANMCYIKCYYISMLTCLSDIVILLKCCAPPFPVSPTMFLFSTTTFIICTTSVLQGCYTLFTLSSTPYGNVFLFLRRSPRIELLCFQWEKGSYICQRDHSPRDLWSISIICALWLSARDICQLLSPLKGLEISGREKKVASYRTDPAFCQGWLTQGTINVTVFHS